MKMANNTTIAHVQAPTLVEMSQDFAALVALRDIMRDGVDYGIIPGCGDKSTLLKPGAEKVLKRFMVHVIDVQVEDMSTADCIRYRVRCIGQTPDGITRGMGIGECSTDEEKYKWRRCRNRPEWDATADTNRRVKYMSGRNGDYTIEQVRTNPADLANTVLKMAKKRSMVDLALTATAASDFFTQDMEDMSPEMRQQVAAERNQDPHAVPIETTAETVHPKRIVWDCAKELGLTGADVMAMLKAKDAPDDASMWTVAQVEQYCDALRHGDVTPEPGHFEHLTAMAKAAGAEGVQLEVAIEDAGYSDMAPGDYTAIVVDSIMATLEKAIGV